MALKRRDFIRSSALAGAGIGLSALNIPLFGKNAPNEKLVVGVMGTNSRGGHLAGVLAGMDGVEVGYICDVEEKALAKGVKAVTGKGGKTPKTFKDVRLLLEEKALDALVIAAPDHWHAPAAIMACQAGKHVYVEKPCSQNPFEGELLIEAARKYNKLVQMGNQRRSWDKITEAIRLVHEGIIGKAYFATGWYANNRGPIGFGKEVPPPANLDWDLWQGPAPRTAYRDNLVHYNWHWFWHWGTGEACNNGTHEIDCMRWALDVDYPTKVNSSGGRYQYRGQDDWETPDTQVISFEFGEEKSLTWEGRSCNNFPEQGSGRGFIVYGEKGTLVTDGGNSYKFIDPKNNVIKEKKSTDQADSTNVVSPGGSGLDAVHLDNFLESIRGNAKLTSDIEEGHKSVLLCHLGNISQRVGRTLHVDPSNGHIQNDREAMKLWKRAYQKGWTPQI
ncbi:MAG: Gfo/Idh/MocA family oxidoreductase [Solitalea sp.]